MTPDIDQLVRDAVEVTGTAPPRLLEADAPTLSLDGAPSDVYFVGLIGGKEVGKSAMVNALAGEMISAVTSHGAGTDRVVAYAHASREPAVRALLEREAAGQYRLVTHALPGDASRVLLDLPDIDSHFESHLVLTRRMLRHMLFPVWLVSIEKYADLQPRQMLSRVAEGNDPRNFVFVLNKADQLGGDDRAAAEIRDDYANRVALTVGTDGPPRVWVVSAARPDAFDLPALRAALTRDRSAGEVEAAQGRAGAQRDRSLVAWLATQDLPQRAERLGRVHADAQEMLTARVAGPILERSLPRLSQDVAYRAALTDEAMAARVARWPLVNLVHTLLAPVLSAATTIVRGGTARAAGASEGLVDAHLAVDGQPLAQVVRATFAHVRHASPAVALLYTGERPWEEIGSEMAATRLRTALVDAIERQRARVIQMYSGSRNPLAALVRWGLTIGALLWFPFAQPVLEAWLQPDFTGTTESLILLVVRLLGTTYLLTTAAFLVVYFTVLWLALRWATQRRVARLLRAWATGDGPDEVDLSRQTLAWSDALLAPLRDAHARATDVARRAEAAGSNTVHAA